MSIADRAIELPKLVLLGAVSVIAIGVAGIFTLPKEKTPRIDVPVIIVTVPNPGATPTTNENQIIDKVEQEVESSLDDLRDRRGVVSQAANGAAVMIFFFRDGKDADQAKREVESLINQVKGQFPPEAQSDPGPTVSDVAFEDLPIIQVVVAGGSDGQQRRRVAEELESQIEKISGVAGVDLFGGLQREVQIEMNPHLNTLYGFSYEQIESAIRRANTDAPTGSIESAAGRDQRVRSRTRLDSIDAIRRLPLGVHDGKPVVLSDVANVHLGYEPVKSLARYDGRDAVVLLVRAKTDINVLDTVGKVQNLVDAFMANRGDDEGIHVSTVRSQAREIGYMLQQLTTSAAYGVVLVILILWIALGWRNATLISISVPFALLGTSAIMWSARQTISANLTINNMTMFGMILVIGMVVDGCIIVGENIYRHRELGRSPIEAAKCGIGEVGGSLTSAYLTTFAAFAPMFMIRGVVGGFLEQLPLVVMFALASAVLVDHYLLPVLSVYWLKVPAGSRAGAARDSGQDPAMSPEEIEIASAQRMANSTPLRCAYGQTLGYALRHRVLVLAISLLVVATPVVAFMTGAIGLEFFPDSDVPLIEVHFELPLGSSLQKRTSQVAGQIEEAVLRAVREDEWYRPPEGKPVRPVTTIGEPGALNTRFDNDITGSGPEFGMVYVELALAEDRHRTAAQIRKAIVDQLPPLPGVIVRVTSPKEGPPVGAPVLVRVLGRKNTAVTLDDLARQAEKIREALAAIPGTYDVTSDYRQRPELVVEPHRTVASLFDIDAAQIATSVNYALEGVRVGDVDFGGTQEIDLRLRNQPGHRDQIEDLANLPLRSPTGKIVSMDQVTRIYRLHTANVIRHYDLQRVINVRAQLEEGVLVDDVKAALVAAMWPDVDGSRRRDRTLSRDNSVIWSDDQVLIQFGGENEDRDEALEGLNVALMAAVGAMLIVLTFKFNSFIQPLIVLFSVPLSLVGVSMGLMLCGFYFSIAAMIGVVALSGIVVNDAIVLVDFINRMRDAGVPMDRAVVYAGQLRLRPIILTTVTTIGGLLPLGLNLAGGGEFFQPLTITIMFGLGFATILQLLVIPLACYTLDFSRGVSPEPVQDARIAATATGQGLQV